MMLIPALVMLVGALLVALLPGKSFRVALLGAPLLALFWVWQPIGADSTLSWLGSELDFFESSPLRQLFATVFAAMAAIGGLYAMNHSRRGELAAGMAYAAGALGVCFAGDLLTFFIFWELMAIFSTVIIWCGGTEAAKAAGWRYALLHFFGGVILMVGIAALWAEGQQEVAALNLQNPAAWCVLIGVLINAGAPPLGAWVADAYPEASAGGTVMLSAFTTKTAVLALILLFPGAQILLTIGPLMVLYGMGYAVLTNDIRRLLAYSIVGQVGFMVTAIGVGTELALNAAAAHAFTHILYKGLLMMAAGAVILQTGERALNRLGGLAERMPFTALCAIVGALTISAVPLTSGYVSKSLISAAVDAEQFATASVVLSFATAAAMVYVGLRIPWFIFFDKTIEKRISDADKTPEAVASEPPLNMRYAMGFGVVACLLIGFLPGLLYGLLPYEVTIEPYSVSKLMGTVPLLLVGAIVFFVSREWLRPRARHVYDTDWLYRTGALSVWRIGQSVWREVARVLGSWVRADGKYATLFLRGFAPEGWLARSLTVGTMMSVLVGLLLLIIALI